MQLTRQDFLDWLAKQHDARDFYNGNGCRCMGHAFLVETNEEEALKPRHDLSEVAGSFTEEGARWFYGFFTLLRENAGHFVSAGRIKKFIADGLDTTAK